MMFNRLFGLLRSVFNNIKDMKEPPKIILVPVVVDNDPSGNPYLYFFEILDCNPPYITRRLK
jgi:hypothetical protein